MNRDDYLHEVDVLRASAALRSRIAALPERAAGKRRARAALRAVGLAACAACILLAVYGASVLWGMTHRGGDLRPVPPVLTAPPNTPTPGPTTTTEPSPAPTPTQWVPGEGYSYTSEALGITVEFPPEWKEYVSFREERRDRCLQRDNGERLDAAVLVLMPPEDTADKIGDPDWRELFLASPYDHSFAQICWVPNGMRWQEDVSECTYVTLWENDEGKYVGRYDPMELSISYSQASWSLVSDPADRERLHTACEAVQNGLRDGQYRMESLHAPEAPVSAVHDWAGSGYSYTSENLGVTVEFPPEWRDYFTFEESGSFIDLMAAWEGDETERYLGCVYFEPNGEIVHSGDDGVSIVLAETDQGRYWLYVSGMTHMYWSDSLRNPQISQTADTIWYGLTGEDLWEIRLDHPPVLPEPTPTPEPTPEPTPDEPQGQYYSYTDPSLGLTVRVPAAWRDSFTFDFATLNSALHGPDGAVLSADTILFRPGAQGDDLTSGQRKVLKAHPYARICWVPQGLTWPKTDERDTDITLLETSGGDYVCRLYPGALEGLDPDTVAALDLQAARELIQAGLRDGLCQAEGLYRPKMTTLRHQVDGVDPNAEKVLDRVTEYIEEDQYESLHHYGTLDPNDYGCPVFDRWRISRLERCYEADDLASGHTLELYYLEWGVHTYAPELAQPHLAGHLTLSEDGWFVPEGGGVYLVFLRPEDGGSPVFYDHFTAPRLDPDDPRTFTEENILGALMEHFSPAHADWTPDTGYTYTSESLGITVKFPSGWDKYFTFVEGRRSDFLHGTEDTSATVLTLIPKASTTGLFFEDPNLAHIYWVPDGAAGPERYSTGNTSVVLAETGAGKYVCLLNVWSKVWLSPSAYLADGPVAVDGLAAAYSAVQDGVLFYGIPRVEVLGQPASTAPQPSAVPDGLVDESIDVPDDVRNAAVEWVRERYAAYVENPDGAWRHPDAVYDNWRIDAIELCEYLSDLAYRPVQVYRLSWQLHTTTPELGGNQAGAYQPVVNGWFTPGYGCDYLAFLCTDDHDYFLSYLMINDASPGTNIFASDIESNLLARIPAPKPEVETYQDPGVPDSYIVYQAGEYIKDQYLLAHLPQTYWGAASRPAGSYDDDWSVDALPDFDDWRITSLRKCYETSMEDLADGLGTAVVYRLDYQLRTTTPELLRPLLADGQQVDGESWFTQRPNGVYLLFRMYDDGLLTFLSVLPETDAAPGSPAFRDAVRQAVTSDSYILGYMGSTFAGMEIGIPLEEEPEALLAVLTPQGEPWLGTPWGEEDYFQSICQRYTAPGIEVITSKVPPEKLKNYLQNYENGDPEDLAALLKEYGAASLEEIYEREIDREYVARITVTGPEYATNLGVRVGMTRAEVEALYRSLTGKPDLSFSVLVASMNAEYTGDTLSKLVLFDMLGRRVGRFFDL